MRYPPTMLHDRFTVSKIGSMGYVLEVRLPEEEGQTVAWSTYPEVVHRASNSQKLAGRINGQDM